MYARLRYRPTQLPFRCVTDLHSNGYATLGDDSDVSEDVPTVC